MEEMIILAMLLCVGLAALGLKMRIWPMAFVSSVGWVIIAVRVFEESNDWLVLGLMIMVAIAQVLLVKEADRWRISLCRQ